MLAKNARVYRTHSPFVILKSNKNNEGHLASETPSNHQQHPVVSLLPL